MTFTHCHNCNEAHADWAPGEVWTCLRCGFRIPAAHLWQWCNVADAPQELTQQSFLEDL